MDAVTKTRQETSERLNIAIGDVHVNSIWQRMAIGERHPDYITLDTIYVLFVSTPQFNLTYNYSPTDINLELTSLVNKETGVDLFQNAVDFLKKIFNPETFKLDYWGDEDGAIGFGFRLQDGSIIKIKVDIKTGEPTFPSNEPDPEPLEPEAIQRIGIESELEEQANNPLFSGQMAGEESEVLSLQNKL